MMGSFSWDPDERILIDQVHAVGGDCVQHMLMRLHIVHRQLAGSAAFVVMVGINNLLGGAGDLMTDRQ